MLIAVLAATLLAQEKTVAFGRSYGQSQALPTYDKGYLLFQQRPNRVEVWNPAGQLAFHVTVAIPNASSNGGVAGLAADTDGSVAATIGFSNAGKYEGGIVLLDRTGKQTGLIKTGRFMPVHVRFDIDHNLWTFGWQRDATLSDREDTEDYLMFRKYSRDGRELAAFVKRSLFPKPGLTPGGAQGGLWRLAINNGWIGAIAYSGKTSEFEKWVQFKPDGSDLTISEIGRDPGRGMAFAGSAGLCRINGEQTTKLGVECFDRASQQWKASSYKASDESGEPLGLLLGAEGSALVFGGSGGNIRLTYIKPAA